MTIRYDLPDADTMLRCLRKQPYVYDHGEGYMDVVIPLRVPEVEVEPEPKTDTRVRLPKDGD